MKKPIFALLLSSALAGGQAVAGGMSEPVMEPTIIEEDSASTLRAGILVPVLALVLIGLALSNNDDGTPPNPASDARLKTDILRVGTAANGLPLYQFRYVGHDAVFEGVMAQDVLGHTPEAVVPFADGYMAVDYGRLGLELKRVR